MRWEAVELPPGQDGTRRLKVPGGWLYQVVRNDFMQPVAHGDPGTHHTGWHAPTFVPDATLLDSTKLDTAIRRLSDNLANLLRRQP